MARILHKKKYAHFVPSVSGMYVVAHSKKWHRQPVDFDLLNFMDDKNAHHFTWPTNLYSAGHAMLDIEKSNKREVMIQNRNRENSVLIGDSGGFQAATGVLDFDWKNPMGPKSIEQRTQILKWLEHTADYSMILDWPAWAIPTGRLPKTLLYNDVTTDPLQYSDDAFQNCLKGTVWNNEWFTKQRTPGKTKFLNVLQGRNYEQVCTWYDAVTPFSSVEKYGDRAFEGWALGGITGGDPSITARVLVKLRADEHLNGDDRWVHVLGRSRLSTAVVYAVINESLSRNLNPNIQFSYDASSAFLYAVNGTYLVDYNVSPQSLNVISADIPMDAKYTAEGAHGNDDFIYAGVSPERLADPLHFKSKLSAMLKMKDLILSPEADKPKPKGYRMDTASYYYLMSHNVEMQSHAVEYACDRIFAPDAVNHIPTKYLKFKDFVERLFATHAPWATLTQGEKDFYTAQSMEICENEGSQFRDLIGGEGGGVSFYEDGELFPKQINLEDISDERPSTKKTPKVEKVVPKMIDLSELGFLG